MGLAPEPDEEQDGKLNFLYASFPRTVFCIQISCIVQGYVHHLNLISMRFCAKISFFTRIGICDTLLLQFAALT